MLSSTRPPTIAVLMPVHNAEPYVAQAVESIRSQSFEDFQLLLLDDGSTDGSLAEMRRQARQDSRITLISRSNTGIVGAQCNAGILPGLTTHLGERAVR